MNAIRLTMLLAASLSFAEDAADASAAKKALEQLQGVWKLTTFEVNAEAGEPGTSFVWVIKGNKVLYANQELAEVSLFPKVTPKGIDLTFLKPIRTYEGIYVLEGDTLKLCVNQRTEGLKERPQEFTTRDKSDWRLLTFKKETDPKVTGTEDLAGFVGIMIGLDEEKKGVVITGIIPDSPAEKADVKKDDLLLQVGGVTASNLRTVVTAIRYVKPGTELILRVRRGEKEKDVTVKAGVLPFYLLD
jgi:uncharacterized protein (TIGR03067 family)